MLLVDKIIYPVSLYIGCRKFDNPSAVSDLNRRFNRRNEYIISDYRLVRMPLRKRITPSTNSISYFQGNHVDYAVSVLSDNPFFTDFSIF